MLTLQYLTDLNLVVQFYSLRLTVDPFYAHANIVLKFCLLSVVAVSSLSLNWLAFLTAVNFTIYWYWWSSCLHCSSCNSNGFYLVDDRGRCNAVCSQRRLNL